MLILGLMSGTSADGLDISLCEITDLHTTTLIKSGSFSYPSKTKHSIRLAQAKLFFEDTDLDKEVTVFVTQSINTFIKENNVDANSIAAIANHGQTILHQPNANKPFSLQIGNGQSIANSTGITVVDNFRAADIAASGQGAPLIPAFHHAVFKQHSPCSIINIGGIANISFVEAKPENVTGFDCGPGNTLMDLWIKAHKNLDFDNNGDWAKSGELDSTLLNQLLSEPYFSKPTPKSTGQDLFNTQWLEDKLVDNFQPANIQRTLLELTAASIANSLKQSQKEHQAIYLCGGGANNIFLIERIQSLLPNTAITTTQDLGVHPQWVESMGFAWLGYCHLNGIPANLPAVTGAKKRVILGDLHHPTSNTSKVTP